MTDQQLRDLLHEAVSDVSGPDLADESWRSGRRARGRRTAWHVAGAATAVVVVAGALVVVQRGASEREVAPVPVTHSSTPTSGPSSTTRPYAADAAPDAQYAGVPVFWSPTVAQEEQLPTYPESPLPTEIDLAVADGSVADDPISHAVAAFAATSDGTSLEYVKVLAPDGRLLTVDTSPVRPMTDPEGNRRFRVGPSLLSRSGRFLLFPQDHSLLIYTLQTGRWRTVDTGATPTWDATWIGNTRIALADPLRPQALAQEYSVDGVDEGSSNVTASGLPQVPLASSRIYGRARTSADGVAQALYAGAPIPEPARSDSPPGGSDWIAITGRHPAILLMSAEADRQKQCCQVDGWLSPHTVMFDSASSTGTRVLAWNAWTGQVFQVSRLTGVELGRESLAASYAQVPAAGAPMRY